ncbi:MAG: hypothetical protein ABI411_09760 [Tahibacter sp.]
MNTYMYRNGFRLLAATVLLGSAPIGMAQNTPTSPPSNSPQNPAPPPLTPQPASPPPTTAIPPTTNPPTTSIPSTSPPPGTTLPSTSPSNGVSSIPPGGSTAVPTGGLASMVQLDANRDNFVDKSEIPVGSPITSSKFARYDANSDGKLSPEEFAKYTEENR